MSKRDWPGGNLALTENWLCVILVYRDEKA